MNTDSQEYKLGQQLFLDGLTYTQLPAKMEQLGKKLVADIFCGWDNMQRETRCSFTLRHWNKAGSGFKTSADIKTLFT